jgi:hypothetical protein
MNQDSYLKKVNCKVKLRYQNSVYWHQECTSMRKLKITSLICVLLLWLVSCKEKTNCVNTLNSEMEAYDYYTWTPNTFYNVDEALNCLQSSDSNNEIILFLLNRNNSSRKLYINYFDSYSFMKLKENRIVVSLFLDFDLNPNGNHTKSFMKQYNVNNIDNYYILNKNGEINLSERIPIWLSYKSTKI